MPATDEVFLKLINCNGFTFIFNIYFLGLKVHFMHYAYENHNCRFQTTQPDYNNYYSLPDLSLICFLL